MIDNIYQVLQTIINKEQSGYVSPEEFNKLAHLAQQEIFRNYFEDINRDQNKENRGLTNRGFANLAANERQRVEQFSEEAVLVTDKPEGFKYATANLPEDIYFIEDRGVMTGKGKVVEQISKSDFGAASQSISAYSSMFPVYTQFGNQLRIYPQSITAPVTAAYIRNPKQPRWTYRNVSGNPMFDQDSSSFQDFELHPSEFSNIVLKMLSHFGLNLRETEVMQIAEQLKNSITQKDNA